MDQQQNSPTLSSGVIILLMLLLALPIVTTDIYLPSLYAITQFFNTNPHKTQLTLTLYFICFSIVQLICGFLSDCFGRRNIMLGSLSVYILATVICIFSNSIEMLIIGRCLQSLGTGGAIIVFAMVRDVYDDHRVAKLLSYMSAVVALSSIIAPIIGGVIQKYLFWQANFMLLLLIGLVLLGVSFFTLPETKKYIQTYSLKNLTSNYIMLASKKSYIVNALAAACAFGALFTYITATPYIFLNILGYSPEKFGLIFVIAAIGYVAGALSNPKLINAFGLDKTLKIGICSIIVGSISMIFSFIDNHISVPGIIISQLICEFGISIVVPLYTTKALHVVPEYAGQASALIGFLRFVCGGIASMAMSQLEYPILMAFMILLFGILCSLGIWYVPSPQREKER